MSKIYAVEYHYVTDRDEEMAAPSTALWLTEACYSLRAPMWARTTRSSWCAPMMRRAR